MNYSQRNRFKQSCPIITLQLLFSFIAWHAFVNNCKRTMNNKTNEGSRTPSEIDSEEYGSSDNEILENVIDHSQAVSTL